MSGFLTSQFRLGQLGQSPVIDHLSFSNRDISFLKNLFLSSSCLMLTGVVWLGVKAHWGFSQTHINFVMTNVKAITSLIMVCQLEAFPLLKTSNQGDLTLLLQSYSCL